MLKYVPRTPGIFRESYNDLIASATMKEILIQSKTGPAGHHTPKSIHEESTPIEIQRDMALAPRFKIDHGPDDPIHPKIQPEQTGLSIIAPASETY